MKWHVQPWQKDLNWPYIDYYKSVWHCLISIHTIDNGFVCEHYCLSSMTICRKDVFVYHFCAHFIAKIIYCVSYESRLSDIFSLNLKHNIPTDSRNPSYFDSSGVQSIFLNIPKCCHIPFQSSCLTWFKWILKRQWPKFKVMLTFIVFSRIQILRAATACKGSKCMPMYCVNIGHSIIVKMCP